MSGTKRRDGAAPDIHVGGIVLCGGQSTRMGSSKALLPVGPETMVHRVVRLLGGVVSPVVVVATRNQSLPTLPAGTTVTHDEREGRGPLEGLRAGLKALPPSVEAAYVTSCDVPLLVPGFVRMMIDMLGDHDIAVMEVGGVLHPLSAVYRRSLVAQVDTLLAENQLRTAFLCETVRTRRVQPAEVASVDPNLLTLRNLNTPDDYRDAIPLVESLDNRGEGNG